MFDRMHYICAKCPVELVNINGPENNFIRALGDEVNKIVLQHVTYYTTNVHIVTQVSNTSSGCRSTPPRHLKKRTKL